MGPEPEELAGVEPEELDPDPAVELGEPDPECPLDAPGPSEAGGALESDEHAESASAPNINKLADEKVTFRRTFIAPPFFSLGAHREVAAPFPRVVTRSVHRGDRPEPCWRTKLAFETSKANGDFTLTALGSYRVGVWAFGASSGSAQQRNPIE